MLGRRSAETLGTRERFGAIGVRRKRVNEAYRKASNPNQTAVRAVTQSQEHQ